MAVSNERRTREERQKKFHVPTKPPAFIKEKTNKVKEKAFNPNGVALAA
jgi:hypothetical protein